MSLEMVSVASAQVQIRSGVVAFVQVDMVDALGVLQRSPHKSRHDFPVLAAFSSSPLLDAVALGVVSPFIGTEEQVQFPGSDLDRIARSTKSASKVGHADGSGEPA